MKNPTTKELIKKDIVHSYESIHNLIQDKLFIENLSNFIDYSCKRIEANSKIIFCGNGGSAAESQHFAAELTSKYRFERPAINSIALTTEFLRVVFTQCVKKIK